MADRSPAPRASANPVGLRGVEVRRHGGAVERDADATRMRATISGKEEVLRVRGKVEEELRQRRDELQRDEKRFQDRETALDRKYDLLEQRDREIATRAADVVRREKETDDRQIELERLLGAGCPLETALRILQPD